MAEIEPAQLQQLITTICHKLDVIGIEAFNIAEVELVLQPVEYIDISSITSKRISNLFHIQSEKED